MPVCTVRLTMSAFTKQGTLVSPAQPGTLTGERTKGGQMGRLIELSVHGRYCLSDMAGSSGAAPMGVADDHAQIMVPTPRKAQRKTMATRGCSALAAGVSGDEAFVNIMHPSGRR